MAAVQKQSFVPTPELEKIQEAYSVGQGESMHYILSQRTAENCAKFLLPHIKPTDKILDVGCGPGFITVDFAALAHQGSATGIDASSVAIEAAVKRAEEKGLKNCHFVLGDAAKLPFPDNTFDVAYSHQVLVHAPNPIDIMREIHRVLKPGGVYGTRESDLREVRIVPSWPLLHKGYDLFAKTLALNGSNPHAGGLTHEWAVQAGFSKDKVKRGESRSYLHYNESYKRWSLKHENKMPKMMVYKYGVVDEKGMDEIAEEWKKWDELPETGEYGQKSFGARCGEVICVK